MASIRKEVSVQASPVQVWDAVRDFGAVHERFARGFVIDTRLDGNARIITFDSGLVMRELLVNLDDTTRRLAYSAVGGRLTHHNGVFQVLADGDSATRLIWTIDLLPNDLTGYINDMMERGIAAAKRTLELQTAHQSG